MEGAEVNSLRPQPIMPLIRVEKNFTFVEGGHISVPFRKGQVKDVSPECAKFAAEKGAAKMVKEAPKNKMAAPPQNKDKASEKKADKGR